MGMNHTGNIKYLQEIESLKLELQDLRERYDAISVITSEGVFVTDGGYCIYANKKGCEMLGYSFAELVGKHTLDFVAPSYRDVIRDRMENYREGAIEVELLRKDKSIFFVEAKAQKHIFKGKEVRTVVVRDVSDFKASVQKLVRSEQKYRAVVENAGDGILIGNREGEIIEVNEGFLKITGFKKEEVLQRHISKLFAPESIKEKPLRFEEVDAGSNVISERKLLGRSGERIPIEMNSRMPSSEYYLTIIRDLRERKKAEEALRDSNEDLKRAKEQAEESDRLKSSFLANMSHEIRTPMNGIIGFAELLKSQTINPEQRDDYVNVILSSGQQLLNIINDVLEISKIETGQVTVEWEPFDIQALLKEVVYFFTPVADRYHNKIVVNTSKCNQAILTGDSAKIQQVLTNLVNNSLKFTESGVVEIGIETLFSETLFYVKDTGIGISEEYIDSIFDRFTKAQHDGIDKQKGTGLGLNICKKLVEIMNGHIWVKSEVGKGSIFYFDLPFMVY
jgi:PAS domain S-box-containing protein